MSEKKHTPGPWHVGTLGDKTHVYDHVGAEVADTGRGEFLERPAKEANARLIAAAPDLLEALQTIATCDLSDLPGDVTLLMQLAISKAQGTQS